MGNAAIPALVPPRREIELTGMLDVNKNNANAGDARVKSAIAHWAPRFVANGVALTDFEEVTAQIQSWDMWCRAWSARAAVHEALGREALANKKFLSAGE